MSTITAEMNYLYSSLAGDPDLGEIVDMFVDEMPGRLEVLASCLSRGDWSQLGHYAHQLKGACGSYGFGQLTAAAARLETACREAHDRLQICEAVEELTALAQRLRRGVSPGLTSQPLP